MNAGSPGRFITLEGGEGAGKSTQARSLAARLQANGIPCVVSREPGGSPGAEDIRKLIVEGDPGRWSALTETLLLFAARADHVTHTLEPALANGSWVVCDRFSDSTYAYQGAGRDLNTQIIGAIEAATIGDFKPDLTLILDIPVEVGLARSGAAGLEEKRFERFDRAFHSRVRSHFLALPEADSKRCKLIDAGGSLDEVGRSIWRTVVARFGL